MINKERNDQAAQAAENDRREKQRMAEWINRVQDECNT